MYVIVIFLQVIYIAKLLFNLSPIRHSDYMVAGQVSVDKCRQHGDIVTVLLAIVTGDYTVTVQSPCSH